MRHENNGKGRATRRGLPEANAGRPRPAWQARVRGALGMCLGAAWLGGMGAAPVSAWNPFVRPDPAVERGNRLLEQGHPAAALRAYDKADPAVQQSPAMQLNRGLAALQAGRIEAATRAFERLEAGAPTAALRHRGAHGLGATALRAAEAAAVRGDRAAALQAYQRAAKAFERALRHRPGDANSARGLSHSLARLAAARRKAQASRSRDGAQRKEGTSEQKATPKPGTGATGPQAAKPSTGASESSALQPNATGQQAAKPSASTKEQSAAKPGTKGADAARVSGGQTGAVGRDDVHKQPAAKKAGRGGDDARSQTPPKPGTSTTPLERAGQAGQAGPDHAGQPDGAPSRARGGKADKSAGRRGTGRGGRAAAPGRGGAAGRRGALQLLDSLRYQERRLPFKPKYGRSAPPGGKDW